MYFNYNALQVGVVFFINNDRSVECFAAFVQSRKSRDELLYIWKVASKNKYESLQQFYESEEIWELLGQLRGFVNYRHQLRVSLPLDRILQQNVKRIDERLQGKNRDRFLELQVDKVFPLPAKVLAIDYAESEKTESATLFTVAKLDDITQLEDIYFESGFNLISVEIAPTALERLANIYFAQQATKSEAEFIQPAEYILLGCDSDSVFWSTAGNLSFEYGEIDPCTPFLAQIPQHLINYNIVFLSFVDSALDLRCSINNTNNIPELIGEERMGEEHEICEKYCSSKKHMFDEQTLVAEEITITLFSLQDFHSIPTWHPVNAESIHSFTLLDFRFFNPHLKEANQNRESFTQRALLAVALSAGDLKHV